MRVFKSYGCLIIMLVMMISSGILALSIARVDDSPYFAKTESGFSSDRDISRETINLQQTENLKIHSESISLTGDRVDISCSIDNTSDMAGTLVVDLYAEDWDNDYCESWTTIFPGKQDYSIKIDYGRVNHPDEAELRFFTYNDIDISIAKLEIAQYELEKNRSPIVAFLVIISTAIFVVSIIYVLVYSFIHIRDKKTSAEIKKRTINKNEIALYLALVLIVSLSLLFVYKNINLSYPLSYSSGDDMGVYAYSKSIRENGLSIITPLEGGTTGADMYDYPYSDKLSFVLVKLISLFTSNPYLAINIFYFLNFYLIAISATFVCRRMHIRRIPSLVVGVLYAFSPYIQLRYGHMWLTPYFMLPFAGLIAKNILDGKYESCHEGILSNRRFWLAAFVSFVCAFTGLYYAFFSAAIITAAIVIRLFSKRESKRWIPALSLIFILFILIGLAVNIIPNIIYWQINGNNPSGEFALRSPGESEYYGLKFVQLLLPRVGHRIGLFAQLTSYYNSHYPLVNENMTASLGLVGSVGFILSLIWFLTGNYRGNTILKLNFSTFLIGTIGGIGALLSVFIHIPMRCYNRISLLIMFFSLVIIALELERTIDKKRGIGILLSIAIICIGIFDQTGIVAKNEYPEYLSAKEFVDNIEKTLQPGDAVFELPYDDWPSPKITGSYQLHVGYIESEGIHWSYGSMEGREESEWQQYITSKDTDTMIQLITGDGYDGIYLDKKLYSTKFGEEETEQKITEITHSLEQDPIISSDETMYFWKIENRENH